MQQPIAFRQNSARPIPCGRHAGRSLVRRILLLGCTAVVAAGITASPASAQSGSRSTRAAEPVSSNEPTFAVNSKNSRMQIVERFSKIVEFGPRVTRVDGFDPAVISVSALEPNRLRVQALSPGVTTMVVVDEAGDVYSVDVFVTGDVRHLQAYIERMFPRSAVTAVKVQDSVVLRGWVTQPEHITHIVEIAEQFFPRVLNQMTVGGGQQVALRVKVMEVQRSKIRQLGFNFLYLTEDAFIVSTPGEIAQLIGVTTPLGGPPAVQTTIADATIVGGFANENTVFQGFLEALRQEGLLKILAEPELVATNGRPAHLLAGGEFPILVPQSLGTVTIEWREFGVRLEAVPTILGGGRVRLELEPEVSERDFSQAVVVQGTTVPGLTTRRANTQVEMSFGETFVIAGLLSMRKTGSTSKVPFLGELPWLGAAFRRVRYDEAETELVIMVTPELVAPLSCDQIPPGGPGFFSSTPTDRELYIDGVLEVPYYGDECIHGAPPGQCGTTGCGTGVLHGTGPLPVGPPLLPGVVPGPEMYDAMPATPPPAPSVSPVPRESEPFGAPPAAPPPAAPESFAPTETSIWGPARGPAPRPTPAARPDGRNPFGSPSPDLFQPVDLGGPQTKKPDTGGTTGSDRTSRPGLIEPDAGWQPTRPSRGLIAPTMK